MIDIDTNDIRTVWSEAARDELVAKGYRMAGLTTALGCIQGWHLVPPEPTQTLANTVRIAAKSFGPPMRQDMLQAADALERAERIESLVREAKRMRGSWEYSRALDTLYEELDGDA